MGGGAGLCRGPTERRSGSARIGRALPHRAASHLLHPRRPVATGGKKRPCPSDSRAKAQRDHQLFVDYVGRSIRRVVHPDSICSNSVGVYGFGVESGSAGADACGST